MERSLIYPTDKDLKRFLNILCLKVAEMQFFNQKTLDIPLTTDELFILRKAEQKQLIFLFVHQMFYYILIIMNLDFVELFGSHKLQEIFRASYKHYKSEGNC